MPVWLRPVLSCYLCVAEECESDEDCGQHGMCVDTQATSFPKHQCYCSAGWFGPQCQHRELTCTHTHAHTHTHARRRTYGRTRARTHARTHAHTNMRARERAHTHLCLCVYAPPPSLSLSHTHTHSPRTRSHMNVVGVHVCRADKNIRAYPQKELYTHKHCRCAYSLKINK